MDKHVVQLIHICVVLDGAEAGEAKPADVALQGSERRHQHVQTQIELLSAYEQGGMKIFRYDV